jgi:hypothetical protein
MIHRRALFNFNRVAIVNSANLRHFSLIAVIRKVEPSRAVTIQKRNRYFAGGSVSEFCELSGEGKIRSSSPLGFTYRPSRESGHFLLANFSAREGSYRLTVPAISEKCLF